MMDFFSEENLIMLAFTENNGWAMVRLGNMYADRNEYDKAYEWYLKAEDTSDYDAYDATFNIANMYYYGWHLEQDYQKAYDRYCCLAELNYEKAIFYLGLYAENGYLGECDYKKALEYYEEAVELGDELSATNLGRMYSLGIGVEVDRKKGFEYYQKAYTWGDDLACLNLGFCYEIGQGVRKSRLRALEYYVEGAQRKEENCIEALGRFYRCEIWLQKVVIKIKKYKKKYYNWLLERYIECSK